MYSKHLGLSLIFMVAQTGQFPGGFWRQAGNVPPPEPPAPLLELLELLEDELLLDAALLLEDELLLDAEPLLDELDAELAAVLASLELDPAPVEPPDPIGGRSGSTPYAQCNKTLQHERKTRYSRKSSFMILRRLARVW
jgi:hypothetical protein